MNKLTPSKNELRNFAFLIAIGTPFLIGWIVPLFHGQPFRIWTLFISLPFIFLGVIKPKLLLYPYRGWIALGDFLGNINSRIILGLIFFLVLQPIALFMKLIGHNPLKKNFNSKKSYREIRTNKEINFTKIF
jgi:hypothetical protein